MAARKPKIKNTIDKKHRKLTRKDIHAAAKRLKNWGRWGKNDEIGTLNFVTPECIVEAARLVSRGRVFSLALNYDQHGPQGAKTKYPALKVLLSVGGWAHNDAPNAWQFTTMAATAQYRHEFIESALALLREYGFDGLDLDWEYPASGERGGFAADRSN